MQTIKHLCDVNMHAHVRSRIHTRATMKCWQVTAGGDPYLSLSLSLYIYICMCVCLRVSVCVCVNVFISVPGHLHTHTHTHMHTFVTLIFETFIIRMTRDVQKLIQTDHHIYYTIYRCLNVSGTYKFAIMCILSGICVIYLVARFDNPDTAGPCIGW